MLNCLIAVQVFQIALKLLKQNKSLEFSKDVPLRPLKQNEFPDVPELQRSPEGSGAFLM